MAPHLSDKERQQIIAYLEDGKSQNWTAKKVGRSVDTVGRIARAEGIESDRRIPEKAIEVAAAVREIERTEIIFDILSTGQTLLRDVKDAREYKDVVTGLAIGIDKHRLETGEATSRTESIDAERRQRMKQNLDEIAVLADHRRSQRSA